MKNFELTSETMVNAYGVTLFRIRCAIAIEKFGVKVGDMGGWIEKETNLSGDAWVSGNAWVSGDAKVSGDAQVSGNAWVAGDAQVYGNAKVSGNALVSGDAQVSGNALVSGDAQVYGNAWVSGDAQVSSNARVSGDAQVKLTRDICWFSIFGSRSATTTVYRTKYGIEITCGCFRSSLQNFVEAVKKTHAGTEFEAEYLAICEVIKIRFKIE